MNWNTHHITEKLHAMKHHSCPYCEMPAILLVALEQERLPEWDEHGHSQYHCIQCHQYFSVDANNSISQEKMLS